MKAYFFYTKVPPFVTFGKLMKPVPKSTEQHEYGFFDHVYLVYHESSTYDRESIASLEDGSTPYHAHKAGGG